jgi:hypothetical protein
MADTDVFYPGDFIPYTVGASVAKGTPVVLGASKMPGITETATASSGTQVATVRTKGVVKVSVKGVDGSGNAAIAVGALIRFTVGDTPKLNVKATGSAWGVALEAVGSGETATIKVKLADGFVAIA